MELWEVRQAKISGNLASNLLPANPLENELVLRKFRVRRLQMRGLIPPHWRLSEVVADYMTAQGTFGEESLDVSQCSGVSCPTHKN